MSVCLSVCLSISSSVCLCISLYVCVYFSVCLCTQSSAKGSLLVEMVCEHINLMEKDYFSCSYVAEDGVKVTSCSLSLIVPYRCRHFIYKLNCYTWNWTKSKLIMSKLNEMIFYFLFCLTTTWTIWKLVKRVQGLVYIIYKIHVVTVYNLKLILKQFVLYALFCYCTGCTRNVSALYCIIDYVLCD